MSYKLFTKPKIFQPLGMTNTGWFYEDVKIELVSDLYELDSIENPIRLPKYHDAGYPEGQLKSNAEDMAKYLQEMIRGYAGKAVYYPRILLMQCSRLNSMKVILMNVATMNLMMNIMSVFFGLFQKQA